MRPDNRLPLVSETILHELEEEFGDPAPVHSFAQDFVAVWDERYARLAKAVRKGDAEASFDALLSVRIASTMVGATRLARFAADLEPSLKGGDLQPVTEALPDMKACGRATVKELTVKYINVDW